MASAALPVLCRATSLVAALASATTALLQCGWALGRCEVGNGEDDGFEELDPFSTSPRFVLAAARRWCVASSPDLVSSFVPPFPSPRTAPRSMPCPARIQGGFPYHFLEESGEWFLYNYLGGVPLSVAQMFGALGRPAVLVASKPKFLGDEVAGGHLLLLARSTFLRHVNVFDMLLGEANKSFVYSLGRVSASSCILDVPSSNLWCGGGSSGGHSRSRR